MPRAVEHLSAPDGCSCSCGARFKSARDLRRHLAKHVAEPGAPAPIIRHTRKKPR